MSFQFQSGKSHGEIEVYRNFHACIIKQHPEAYQNSAVYFMLLVNGFVIYIYNGTPIIIFARLLSSWWGLSLAGVEEAA